jgi:hypothetical protein
MDLSIISQYTQSHYGFKVIDQHNFERELEYHTRSRSGEFGLFDIAELSGSELKKSDRDIAEICHAVFKSFRYSNYVAESVVIGFKGPFDAHISVFANNFI